MSACCGISTPIDASSFGAIDRLARSLILARLSDLREGSLEIVDPIGEGSYGSPGDLSVRVDALRPRFYRRVLFGGALGAAEAYMDGDCECDDLTSLVRLFIRDARTGERLESAWSSFARAASRSYHRLRSNTLAGSRRNIGAHYDLGNDFFSLWLDDTLAYSSGIFPSGGSTLREASIEKFDQVCRRLELQPGDQLLEIGTGWGGFAMHAASRYGCRVTTTTISTAQHELASRRVAEAGLSDRVEVLLADYRDLDGRYDKLASIEMVEAVGYENLDAFFARCSSLLRADGTGVLQAIVLPERNLKTYLRTPDFIQRYVFPGGCLPTIAQLLESSSRADFRFSGAVEFGLHYAETLRRWRERFHERLAEVRALGYSERFVRLWTYYLCYCEAAFEERQIGVVHLTLDKPRRRSGLHGDSVERSLASGFEVDSTTSVAGCGSRRNVACTIGSDF